MISLLQFPCKGLFGECIGNLCPAYNQCVDEEEEEDED